MSDQEGTTGEGLRVVKWIDYHEARTMTESIGGMGGWFERGMRWRDYIDAQSATRRPHYEALREAIVVRCVKFGGDDHQSRADGVPVFSDGTVGTFSFRAWGDLLAAVWSTEDGVDRSYMDFYMGGESQDVDEGTVP